MTTEIRAEAERVLSLAKDDQYVGGQILADMVLSLDLPDCPTCGGAGTIVEEYVLRDNIVDCPAKCDNGKVPIAQLVAAYNALWDETKWSDEMRRLYHNDPGFHAAIYILRSVKP